MLKFKVFGKKDCVVCKETINKLDFFLNKWQIKDKVGVIYHDMETVDGLAEGAYHEVVKIPTVIILNAKERFRWEGIAPSSEELKIYVEGVG